MRLPFASCRDDARRVIRVFFHRQLRIDELLALIDWQVEEGAWSYGVLYDLRAVLAQYSRSDVDQVAAHVFRHLIAHGPRGPIAFVTRSVSLIGPLQLYSYVLERADVRAQVFWCTEDAEAWLDQQLA